MWMKMVVKSSCISNETQFSEISSLENRVHAASSEEFLVATNITFGHLLGTYLP